MKRTTLFLFALLVSALCLVGCCDCRKRSKLEKPLMGTEWQLVQIMAEDIVAEGNCYTLTFKNNGTITGMGNCNVFSATFMTTPKRELKISNISSTRKLCPDFETENKFFDMLEGVTHYEMDADHMLLLSNGTLVAILQAVTE